MFPTFLVIGAQKAGTSWLHFCLREHPDVYMPLVKEIHYFDGHLSKNLVRRMSRRLVNLAKQDDYEKIKWLIHFLFAKPRDDAWYEDLFPAGGYKAVGDITPAYSTLSREQVAHVKRLMPRATIFFIMRNPIDRVWSQVRFNFGRQDIKVSSLSVEQIIEHMQWPDTVQRTMYLTCIENWEAFYSPDQIHYMFFDDLVEDRYSFLAEVCRIVGVDYVREYFTEFIDKIANPSKKAPMPRAVKEYLVAKYADTVFKLNARFGGVTDRWLQDYR